MNIDHETKVAVWMITYNHAPYITKAIESVLRQECNFSLHLYIGIDYSTDETLNICSEYAQKYPNLITIIKAKKRIGASKNALAVYRACIQSKAKYMAMLEGDDYWISRTKLQDQVNILERDNDIAVVCSSYNVSGKTGDTIVNSLIPKQSFRFTREENMLKWYTKTCTVCMRLNSINIHKLAKYKHLCDYIVLYHVLTSGDGYYMSTPTAFYRVHDGGSWSSKSEMTKSRITYLITKELFFHERQNVFLRDLFLKKTDSYIKNALRSHNTLPDVRNLLAAPLFYLSGSRDLKKTIRYYVKLSKKLIFN